MANVRANASASTRGTIYQLCLAVDKCYGLAPGQKLLIEDLGDLTIEDDSQFEVKAYSDELTDGHPNFWNTLTNWLDPAFPSGSYQALILLTTQSFSAMATLSAWNDSKHSDRIEILEKILVRSEDRIKKKQDTTPDYKPSKAVMQQRSVLAPKNRKLLISIVDKIFIDTGHPAMPELYKRIRNERSIGILQANKDLFVKGLLGFVCFPEKKAGASWEISHEDFDDHCQILLQKYCNESRTFPTQHYDEFDEADIDLNREDLFIEKIRDIQHHIFLAYAIKDYESTVHTIASHFEDYSARFKYFNSFRNLVKMNFLMSYDTAQKNTMADLGASQVFYNNCQVAPAPTFTGYSDVQTWFRNGIIHICMNDLQDNFRWSLNP
ncbi:hypothetical protein GJ699_00310 [Duganella sp. FT80W]|uniref:Uncharacterized protein n=1 Tax=Duganella guangzhouensis TaxID=2666084 RepID=A0A6I2KW59_9BURK|nr:hypothetical protein [Duganella guangzhouensis]MRW88426.1 hypothetical protein [Duganella guangzhouensis]